MAKLNVPKIEEKWQKRWEKAKLYETKDKVKGKKNFYHLVMFPYPSGDLHIGHWFNFAPADIYARFKRMQGLNVLSPIGFDAFGLPAENAAIKRNIHPAEWTFQNIETMRTQIKRMGPMYDWSREVVTCEPEYYRWTQWMFLQMFKADLAKKRNTWANWCPSCKTVLANEQVIAGHCERCNTEVIQKQIAQWVFTITTYAKRLLDDLEGLDWPERTKIMQRNWIGRSEGSLIKFPLQTTNYKLQTIEVFTTRPDTIFGATYLVLAPEHELLKNKELRITNYAEVEAYINQALKKTPLQRQAEQKKKTGVEVRGIKAINPATNEKIPIWVADYVLAEYGTGAIMAVPAHDARDFAFANAFKLPIRQVILPFPKKNTPPSTKAVCEDPLLEAYDGEGILVNSKTFNGMSSQKAREEITRWLGKKHLAKKEINYRLRDWIVSRQRYWGAPIPIVECATCGLVPVPEEDLPVLLPELKDFRPADDGRSPLAKVKEFVNAPCPKCNAPSTRETDTMDTFVDSSWYFLRYADPKNKKEPFNKLKVKSWLPVDIYIGGAEHTVLHLLYSRFFIKVLHDLNYIEFSEPFTKLRHQGTILGPDGQKMSKSRGNVIAPDPLIKQYGADVVRMYLAFLGPYDQGGPWNPEGINGIVRFLEKISRIILNVTKNKKLKIKDQGSEKLLHKTIKKVTEDLEELKFNTAISSLMLLVNEMQKNASQLSAVNCQLLVLLLAPFAPYLAEELWFKLGHKTSIHLESFPSYDEALIQEKNVTLIIQVNGKLRGKIDIVAGLSQEEVKKRALGEEKISPWTKGKSIKKTIFIPDKLINFVTS